MADNRPRGRRSGARPQNRVPNRSTRDQRTLSPGKVDDWRLLVDAKRREQRDAAPAYLVDIDDTDSHPAEAEWRNHKLPDCTIDVPDHLFWQDSQHETIARIHKTFVIAQDRYAESGLISIGIWASRGDDVAARRTKQDIHDWVLREIDSKRVQGLSKFAKSKSQTADERRRAERKWQREVVKQQYRQAPLMGAAFGAIGTFRWPVEDYDPEAVLGPSFEALDRIRMDTACHIIFTSKIESFNILGSQSGVTKAVVLLRNVCFQIAARQLDSTRRYLLHNADDSQHFTAVALKQYTHPHMPGDDADRDKTGQSPRGEDLVETDGKLLPTDGSSHRNALLLKAIVVHQLSRLHFYRGHLDLRIRLGRFLMTQYKMPVDGSYSFEDFQGMLKQTQFRGEVTMELGHRTRENAALHALQGAKGLLVPQSGMIARLSNVKPVYTAVFIFTDRAGDLRHSVTWHEVDPDEVGNSSEVFDTLSRSWVRLDRSSSTPFPLVDVSLTDLTDGSAWQFDLVGAHAVENKRLPENLAKLADHIKIDPEEARRNHGDINFISRFTPYLPTKSYQQRVSYRYNLAQSDYVVELTRSQDRICTASSRNPGDYTIKAFEPRWSLEVYHSSWATQFAQNENLAVGAKAQWDAKVGTWFPMDDMGDMEAGKTTDDGLEQLLAKLEVLRQLVMRSAKEIVGGMEVA
ncbi:hypothetical protein B0A48_07851 [Cryoendolithus antarcticus]|uniref:DUF7905 domain-containing protein n=1 Tax=Cryoendolithus antarcticus TaxID=1507870 RepID=A0A1V8T0H5_9PEZI|nr:hypothetical protein B0A48_07851 [Cryoendolithus antarcticus]